MGHEILHVCGGDILGGSDGGNAKEYGSDAFYRQWYRRTGILDPFIRSASERRDIQHDAAMTRHLKQVCESFKPDLIWERSSRLHCAGLISARRLGVPYVLEWKDHLVDYPLSLFRRKALRLELLKNREADYIVVESGVLRDQLNLEGIDREKIIVAHNAVEAEQFARDEKARVRVRREMGLDDQTILVGYLGSYAFYHDTARLVLAADIIRKNNFVGKIKILMVGAGKEYQGSRKLAEDLGLLDDMLIMLPGVPKDEVPGILSALDVAVLPGSTDIICPIKVQEYMAASLPAVIPDYACNREIVTDQVTGILFKPGDAADLAGKLEYLATNSMFRVEVGKNAALAAKQSFSWEATWGRALNDIIARINR
jgi:glycosyltransferase involved in cell wall biosynthesis